MEYLLNNLTKRQLRLWKYRLLQHAGVLWGTLMALMSFGTRIWIWIKNPGSDFNTALLAAFLISIGTFVLVFFMVRVNSQNWGEHIEAEKKAIAEERSRPILKQEGELSLSEESSSGALSLTDEKGNLTII